GLLDLKEICAHMIEMSEFAKIRLAGIVFGSDDFCANIGKPFHQGIIVNIFTLTVALLSQVRLVQTIVPKFYSLGTRSFSRRKPLSCKLSMQCTSTTRILRD